MQRVHLREHARWPCVRVKDARPSTKESLQKRSTNSTESTVEAYERRSLNRGEPYKGRTFASMRSGRSWRSERIAHIHKRSEIEVNKGNRTHSGSVRKEESKQGNFTKGVTGSVSSV